MCESASILRLRLKHRPFLLVDDCRVKIDGALLLVNQFVAAGIGGVQLFMQSNGYLQTEQA